MIYKIIGASLLLICAACTSCAVIISEKKHIEQLLGFISLIGFIESQISNFNLPIPEILKKTDRKILSDCGLGAGEENSLFSLHEKKDLLLDEKEKKVVFEFADSLGRSYRDGQIALCRASLSELEKLSRERKEDYPKKIRLALTLSFCAAFALIIFML